MVDYFKFYHTSNNPTGLSGVVGGAISATGLSGRLGELFATISAPPTGTSNITNQYRKVHVKNESASTLSGVKLWLDAIDHSGQISMGLEGIANTITGATGSVPNSVSFTVPSSYTGGLDVGTMNASTSTGIWLRQALSGIHRPDPYASFALRVGGIIP